MLPPLNRAAPRAPLTRLESAPKPTTQPLERAPALDRAETDAQPVVLKHASRSRKRTWQMPRLHFEDWTRGGRNRRRMREARQAFVGRDFERAREKLTNVVEETKGFDARLLLACVQASVGAFAEAEALLHTLHCERPYDETTHLARAMLAFSRNDAGQAWVGLTQVTVHYPGNSVAWVFRSLANGALNYENLATMDIAHLRRTLPDKVLEPVVEATNDLRRGLVERAYAHLDGPRQAPHHPEVVDILWAHINTLLGFRDDALATYDAMLRRDPVNVVAAMLRASALRRDVGAG